MSAVAHAHGLMVGDDAAASNEAAEIDHKNEEKSSGYAVMCGQAILGYRQYPEPPAKLRGSFLVVRLEECRRLLRYVRRCGHPSLSRYEFEQAIMLPAFAVIAARDRAAHAVAWGNKFVHRDVAFNLRNFAAVWLPRVSEAEVEQAVSDTMARRYRFKADTLGKRLALPSELHARLGIKTIGAADMSAEDRRAEAKLTKQENDRARATERRRDQGARPRDEFESMSDAALCRELNISPRTYRDWKKKKRVVEKVAERRAQLAVTLPRSVALVEEHSTEATHPGNSHIALGKIYPAPLLCADTAKKITEAVRAINSSLPTFDLTTSGCHFPLCRSAGGWS